MRISYNSDHNKICGSRSVIFSCKTAKFNNAPIVSSNLAINLPATNMLSTCDYNTIAIPAKYNQQYFFQNNCNVTYLPKLTNKAPDKSCI